MTYYQLKVNGKIMIDRLIQRPRQTAAESLIHEGNVVGNILKLYAELDPAACLREWGDKGSGVLKTGHRRGNMLEIDGVPYDFVVDSTIQGRGQERCFAHRHVTGREPYWILAHAGKPDEWIVCRTNRRRDHLQQIITMCHNGFFAKYGIQSVALTKIP